MEGLEKNKSVYLKQLEDAERKIKSFTADMTTEGMRFYLLYLLHEIKRTNEFFIDVETLVNQTKFTSDMLEIDADVDYSEWAGDKYWQLNVDVRSLQDGHGIEPLDMAVDEAADELPLEFRWMCPQKGWNKSGNRQLYDALVDTIGQLRTRLLNIGHRQTQRELTLEDGEKLYKEEEWRFGLSEAAKVATDFKRWKCDCEDDHEIILKRIEGKKLTELKTFFDSGFLGCKIEQQCEMDFSVYRDEVDMERLKSISEDMNVEAHYSALREFFHYRNGVLVPRKDKIGKYFFKHRKEVGRAHRAACFRLVRMLSLIEEEKKPKQPKEELNYEGIKIAMLRTYFPKCADALCKGFDAGWLGGYMNALMESEFREGLARNWAVGNKRVIIACLIIGALKEAQVLEGNYSNIARMIDEANARTLAKYIGQAKRNAITEWTKEYIENKK
ncbi:MAG: hypothetical protein IKY99_06195 [Bacteroidaceae bacterium]|nr:hypothetical protein [Bacteroidaceae bacterium]